MLFYWKLRIRKSKQVISKGVILLIDKNSKKLNINYKMKLC